MIDDLDKLQRMLEQATAADDPPEDEMDPQTARLREAWTAFGGLLRGGPTAAEESLDWLVTPPVARPKRQLATRLAAVAAALAIGICVVWILPAVFRSDTAPARQKAAVATAARGAAGVNAPKVAKAPIAAKAIAAVGKKKAVVPAASATQWDDPIDSQFVEVAQDVLQVRENWSVSTRSLDLVQYAVTQAQQEVEKSPL
jgi:hypothetical protein